MKNLENFKQVRLIRSVQFLKQVGPVTFTLCGFKGRSTSRRPQAGMWEEEWRWECVCACVCWQLTLASVSRSARCLSPHASTTLISPRCSCWSDLQIRLTQPALQLSSPCPSTPTPTWLCGGPETSAGGDGLWEGEGKREGGRAVKLGG